MIKNPVIYLRISYWIGAILDAKAAIITFFPNLLPQLYIAVGGNPGAINSIEANSFKNLAQVMVFTWACLLIWADRKPLERKGVLLLTLIPALPGILGLRLFCAVMEPQIPILYNAFTLILAVVGLFFAFSYIINSINRNLKWHAGNKNIKNKDNIPDRVC